MPAEWAPHEAVWIGFPSDPELWLEDLAPAQAEVAAFARAVHAGGRGERVILVAATETAAQAARSRTGDTAEVIVQHFGDIWLRDTGPIIVTGGGTRGGRDFGFNGWGGKYDLPGDDTIGDRLAESYGLPVTEEPWVFEGGAIDVDGAGLAVTTEQCLLNPNRNPDLTRGDIEARLHSALGIDRVLWLGDGLLNDHTDGHVDNLARFVAPGRIERDGEVIPASYMNFYIGNAAVVVPQYGAPNDAAAVAAIQALFPDRVATGFRADHILTGGGSFHCISQQIPRIG